VGRYRSHDLDAEADITLDGDTLRAHIHGAYGRRDEMKAEVLSDVVFVLTGESGGFETLLLWTAPGEEPAATFRVESLRVRHARFDRVA
jgi:hypothetical protein